MKALKIPLIIILCLTVLATQVTAAYPPSIYLYDLPATATYTIKTDGTNIWYVRYDGFTYSSTSANTTFTNVFTALPTGGTVYISEGTYTGLHLWLPHVSGTWILKGDGQSKTKLQSAASKSLFDVTNTNWDEDPTIIMEDLTLNFTGTATDSYNGVNFDFWNVHFTRVRFYGTVGNSYYMFRGGGSGASAIPSSFIDCSFVNAGGLLNSWMMRTWYECLILVNPVFALVGGDIRGLMYMLGTETTILKPTIHSWSGRDITIQAFTVTSATMHVSIQDIYYNHSGATAPTYTILGITGAANNEYRNSTTVTINNIRIAWQDAVTAATHLSNGTVTSAHSQWTGYLNNCSFANYGNGTIAAGQNHVHVANPCPSTPTIILVTPTNTTAGAYTLIVNSKTASEFIVTQASSTGAGNFYYYAVYKP